MKDKKFRALLKKIIQEKTHCFFISPHLDDAALSAGGLISYLADKVPVKIVNVFTEAHSDPPTLSAKAFLTQSGFKDASSLFSERKKEESQIYKEIGVEIINLGYFDALWRKKQKTNMVIKTMGNIIPELVHLYPTYRFHGGKGKLAVEDNRLKVLIKKKLLAATGAKNNYLVFCPIAIGKHVDHILVRDVCSEIFDNIIYWSDFNYSLEFSGETKFIQKKKLKLAYFDEKPNLKKKLIEGYKSQIKAIFPHEKIPIVPDFYYL